MTSHQWPSLFPPTNKSYFCWNSLLKLDGIKTNWIFSRTFFSNNLYSIHQRNTFFRIWLETIYLQFYLQLIGSMIDLVFYLALVSIVFKDPNNWYDHIWYYVTFMQVSLLIAWFIYYIVMLSCWLQYNINCWCLVFD